MVNNPFRGKPKANIQKDYEKWGKVKFKPSKFNNNNKTNLNKHEGGKGNKPFSRKFDNRKDNFYKNKDSYKFNQVAGNAKPEDATPWNKYKDEIFFKQEEEKQRALRANMDTEEAKKALKQREINYRKLLIEEKKQEPINWEDFEDDLEDAAREKEEKQYKSPQYANETVNKGELKLMKNVTKASNNSSDENNKLELRAQKPFKKNFSNSKHKGVAEEILYNFENAKLNYAQNDKMRKIITKTTTMAYGTSLKSAVKDLKHKKSIKQKRLNKNGSK